MRKRTNYSRISPVDPDNPFQNPTEEPYYNPDYREILPEMEQPDAAILFWPDFKEHKTIRQYYGLVFFTLLFAFFSSSAMYVALRMIVSFIIQILERSRMGELPQNYSMILSQYIDDSSIAYALTLISFLCCNLISFRIGCKLTGLTAYDCIGKKEFRRPCGFGTLLSYIFIGLWIQLISGLVIQLLQRLGCSFPSPDISIGTNPLRVGVLVLYTCLIAPVTEELLMRGFALKNLSRVSQRFGIFCSAFLFGIMHDNIPQFVFTFPLGILLAYITIQYNSVFPAIAVHMCCNTAGILISMAQEYTTDSFFRYVNMSYMLLILLIGTICLVSHALSERLPDTTPHQKIRCERIAVSSGLFWVFMLTHACVLILSALHFI
ncbi:MAG: CPBP family intramembrane metalloprotease [Oscillospiraceae bacterium]|nr:CPBP family intramembrane metalloprotease [Oscillospiraceae bacterium]